LLAFFCVTDTLTFAARGFSMFIDNQNVYRKIVLSFSNS